MEGAPDISVIMPVYNGEAFVGEAVASVLTQTWKNIELIVVDDGSTDGSPKILHDYAQRDSRLRILKNEGDKGIVGALNTAIAHSRARFIARMDADDICLPNRLSKQLAYLRDHPDVDLCGSWVKTFGRVEGAVWRLPVSDQDIRTQMLFYGALAHPAVMWRREVLENLGARYDQNFVFAEDYELWTRLAGHIRFANVPNVLLRYRTHDTNIGTVRKADQESKTRKIQLRELEKLGIHPSEDEFEIHRKISSWSFDATEEFLTASLAWFDKLREANRATSLVDPAFLDRFLSTKENEIRNFVYPAPVPVSVTLESKVREIAKQYLPKPLVPYLRRAYPILAPYAREGLRAGRKIANKVRRFSGQATQLQTTLPKKFKIGMAVLAYERPDYLEKCLDSLFQTKLYDYDVTFLIIDDGSRDPRVKEIVNLPRNPMYKIVRSFTPKGPNNAGAAINKGVRALLDLDDFDIIGWTDPDALYHPEWLHKTMQICIWAKANHKDHVLGPFSSFNSSDYAFHRILGTYKSPYGNYVVKRQMGMLNYFYFKEDLLRLGYFDENPDDETLMTNRLEAKGVRNFCTETSYVEHMGQLSVLNQWRPVPVQRAVYGVNLAPEGWPPSLPEINTLGYFKDVKRSHTIGPDIKSTLRLEAVIAVTHKDADMLPLVIQGLRRNLRHPLSAIHIVAPDHEVIKTLCQQLNCHFVHEDTVLPINKRDIIYRVGDVDRSGWLFQQLLKLAGDKLVQEAHYFVIDADTVLVQPQVVERDGQPLLLHSDEFHRPYFDVCRSILGIVPQILLSGVAHQMVFSVDRLRAMKARIEEISGRKWYEAILDNVDYNELSGFSEFELYSQWCMTRYSSETPREYWFNIPMPRNRGLSNQELEKQYGLKYRSVSLHDYLGGTSSKGILSLFRK